MDVTTADRAELITEIRRLRRRLKIYEQIGGRLDQMPDMVAGRSLFFRLRAPISIYTVDGLLLALNPASAEAFGRPAEELVGRRVENIYPDGKRLILHRLAHIGATLQETTWEDPVEMPPFDLRWFWVNYQPLLDMEGRIQAVQITSFDITEWKRAEAEIERQNKELAFRQHELEEANTALKVLLERRDEDRRELTAALSAQVRDLIVPILDNLRGAGLPRHERRNLDLVIDQLRNLVSRFSRRLIDNIPDISPRENQVAHLVREGLSTKEIADMLGVSTWAVNYHRKNLRRKMNLTNSGRSLGQALARLDE